MTGRLGRPFAGGARWLGGASHLLLLLLLAAPAKAEGPIAKASGHLALGYARLFIQDAPGGSFSLAAGADYPIANDWLVGATLDYELLGSRTVKRGSLLATVDYSMIDMVMFAHWQPPGLGPLGRVSVGPGLFGAHSDLSTAGGGALFSDLAVQEVAPGLALEATLMKRGQAPVRIGFETSLRMAFLESQTWTVATGRVAFHY
jgi:hypothetical protein